VSDNALHPDGEQRVQIDGYMCPECGFTPRAFCPGCLGAGIVTEQRLYELNWEYTQRMARARQEK